MRTSIVVAIVASFFGVVQYCLSNPGIFLHVPFVGFYFYAAFGGDMPPYVNMHAVAKCYKKENCPWLKENSVVIDVCGKCGTNWMYTVVHELRTWNFTDEEKDFSQIPEISPFLEFLYYPGVDPELVFLEWPEGWNRTEFPFTQFTTHIPPFKLNSKGAKEILVPVRERPDIKFLVVVRNPLDEMLSAFEFTKKLNPEAMKLYGGMPKFEVSFENYFDLATKTSLGLSLAPEFYKAWKDYEDDENVLLLHYTDVFEDTEAHVRKIADFIGIKVDDAIVARVMKRISIDFMKTRNDKYNLFVGKNKDIRQLLDDAMINKGGIGRGNSIPEGYQEKLKAYVEDVLPDPKDRDFLNQGARALLN